MIGYEEHSKLYWKIRARYRKIYRARNFLIWLFYELPRNYYLVKKYPFLKPQVGWGVDMEWKRSGYRYHYEETWLDGLPRGWRKAFGLKLCDDLKKALANCSYNTNDYKVHQVKEKFGYLCWYDEGGNNLTRSAIDKYVEMSSKVCQICGKPATHATVRWIGFYCEDCAKKLMSKGITCTQAYEKQCDNKI